MTKNPDPVTEIIRVKVKAGRQKDFEEWSNKVTAKAREHSGFQNVTTIRPSDPTDPEYVVIVHWASYDDLKNFEETDFQQKMIEDSEDFTLSMENVQKDSGMGIWFDWPKNTKLLLKPSFLKQTVVAILTVTPLVFGLGAILGPLLAPLSLPLPIFILVNVLVSAPLLTLLMPQVTKFLHPWLYPKHK